MKKIAAILITVVIAAISSFSAFAVDSPSGVPQEDKYSIVGIIVQGNKAIADVSVSLDDGPAVMTDSKGAYKLENVTVGSHKITLKKGNLTGEFNFVIASGSETKFSKNSDGSYSIFVAQSVTSLDLGLSFDSTGKATILKLAVAGNNSPSSPITGDVFGSVLAIIVLLSAAALTLYKKAYSL